MTADRRKTVAIHIAVVPIAIAAALVAGTIGRAQSPEPYRVELPPHFNVLQPRATAPTSFADATLGEDVQYIPNDLAFVRWGVAPNRDAKPIVTVASGAVVQFDVISHEGLLEDQGRDPVRFFGRFGLPRREVLDDAIAVAASQIPHDFDKDGPHVISPPVGVRGAAPGDVLKIDVLRLEPRVPYGVNSIRHGKGALPGEYPRTPPAEPGADAAHPARFNNVSFVIPIRQVGGAWYGFLPSGHGGDVRVPVRPFLGTMGVAQNTAGAPSSVPPGPFGGNIDNRHLVVGSSLYLPVQVPGAQFYVSDAHFAQGNGEVSLTAIEGSLRATLRLTLLKAGDARIPIQPLTMPFAEDAADWIPMGIDADLDAAMKSCLHQSLAFLTGHQQMQPDNALSFLSIGADFDIGEVVDRTMQVHALIPKAAFRR